MKDKHLYIESDSKLLKKIHAAVTEELATDNKSTVVLLLFKFFFYFLLMASAYTVLFLTSSQWLFFTAFIAYGIFTLLLGFNFAHDFSHNTVFKNKKANHFCYVAIYTLLGAHAEAWKQRHVHSHHYAPNVHEYDSDLQITSLIRVEPVSKHSWYHQFQHWYAPLMYSTYSLYWITIKDARIYWHDCLHSKKLNGQYHISFWLQKIFYSVYLLVLPLLFSHFNYVVVLLAFLSMHLVQSVFLLFTFFITHHVEATAYFMADDKGCITTSWLNNQVKSSNDFYPFSNGANFIFGGFNNHIAHHLFPHIHHIHYPKLNRILYRILNEHGITPNETGYFSGIVSHLKHLKNLSRDGEVFLVAG